MPTLLPLAALLIAPALWFLAQAPLRRHRYAGVAREFAARWSELTSAQKRHVLAQAGHPASHDPDGVALALLRGAWQTMRAGGDVDFHRLRGYGEALLRTGRQAPQHQ